MHNKPFLPLPSREECLALMESQGMLPHIREHSFRVTAVAALLGQSLVDAGLDLNLALIEAGALLHDLGKTPCLGTGQNHAQWGAQILEGLGYPTVAAIVREHVVLEAAISGNGVFSESAVVNYADKRVLHTRVVSLKERFDDLKVRYGRTPEARERIAALEVKARALEEKLFAPLSLAPDMISSMFKVQS